MLRSAWWCARLAFRLDTRRAVLVLVAVPLALLTAALLGAWQREAVNAVVNHDIRRAYTACALLAASLVLSTVAASAAARHRIVLERGVGGLLDTETVSAALGFARDDQMYDGPARAHLDALRGEQVRLGQSLTACVMLLAAAAPFAGTVALMLTVDWHLAAIFPAAVAEITIAHRASRRSIALDQRFAPLAQRRRSLWTALTDRATADDLTVNEWRTAAADGLADVQRTLRAPRRHEDLVNLLCLVAAKTLFVVALVWSLHALMLLAMNGQRSVGDVVLGLSLVRRGSLDLAAVTRAFSFFRERMHLLGRLSDLKRLSAAVPDELARTDVDPAAGLSLRGVGHDYGGGPVLDDVTAHLAPGTVTALVGPNGAGKTTLVRVLTGAMRPTTGSYTAFGTPAETLTPAAWRHLTSVVYQPFLRAPTALRTALQPDPDLAVDDDRLAYALAEVGLADLAGAADGLDVLLDPSLGGRDLSGGQWQRVALARSALRLPARLVVLDEATSALDPFAEAMVLDRVRAMMNAARDAGSAVVIVTHRLSLAREADAVLLLDAGRVQAHGHHDELMRTSPLYADLYSAQARNYVDGAS